MAEMPSVHMSDDVPQDECYFPPARVERIGNCVMIQCQTEDDSIIVFEMFKDVSLGKTISFRAASGGDA